MSSSRIAHDQLRTVLIAGLFVWLCQADLGAQPAPKELSLDEAVAQLHEVRDDQSELSPSDLYRALEVASSAGGDNFATLFLEIAARYSVKKDGDLATFYALKHYWRIGDSERVSKLLDFARNYEENYVLAVGAVQALSPFPDVSEGDEVSSELRSIRKGLPRKSQDFSRLSYAIAMQQEAWDAFQAYQGKIALVERLQFLRQFGIQLSHPHYQRRLELDSPVSVWAKRELERLSRRNPARVAEVIYNWALEIREQPLSWPRVFGWRQCLSEPSRAHLDRLLPAEDQWIEWGLKK